jgi:L-ascorbate metabolism protein UlaG (beta-lactamase superfamily)
LFDPVFEEQYISMGPKRFTPAACKPGDFPALDAVFISHNHHDHLSYTSVKEIVRIYPLVHFFVGLGLAKWFHDSGINAVTEMDWWDDAEVVLERTASSIIRSGDLKSDDGDKSIGQASPPPERISARVSCLPAQHVSMRSGLDFNRTLWASWAVTSGAKSVWFAGDTGYRCIPEGVEELGPGFDKFPRNPQFSQIGELRGPFDLGLIPIGAYHPRFMYSGVHASPYDAVEIFQDTKCKMALGIHWGTWALTSEAVDEPPEKLKQALKIKGLVQTGLFDVCAIGESRDF